MTHDGRTENLDLRLAAEQLALAFQGADLERLRRAIDVEDAAAIESELGITSPELERIYVMLYEYAEQLAAEFPLLRELAARWGVER